MKRIIFVLVLGAALFWLYIYLNKTYWLSKQPGGSATPEQKIERQLGIVSEEKKGALLEQALELLRVRKDKDALVIFSGILSSDPGNTDALWGKAEVLRRQRDYVEAEYILEDILARNPAHGPSLVSMSYIRYQADKLSLARELVRKALGVYTDNDTRALAYMMLGSINSRLSKKSIFFGKIKNAAQIEPYFLKARDLSGELPEVHLGLGTFYLLAPGIMGGDIYKATRELEKAVEIAPDFATANARLAQAYKRRGNLEKYNFHIQRAQELDPDNEVLKEIGIKK